MKLAVAVALALLAGPAIAQHQGHGQGSGPGSGHGAAHGKHSPYAGLQQRAIKSLSEEQIADLRKGRGMGLALAAELNGYPGPLHVLELSERLQLTPQKHHFQQLYESMKAEAIAVGEVVIARERELDEQFAKRKMTPEALAETTARIGAAQGHLRAVHLKYHLTTADLLTDAQRQQYAELRGYR